MNNLLDKIVFMKMVWVYVMLGSIGAFMASLGSLAYIYTQSNIPQYSIKLVSILGIVLWGLSFLFMLTSVFAFIKAARQGKEEDEMKKEKNRMDELWRGH